MRFFTFAGSQNFIVSRFILLHCKILPYRRTEPYHDNRQRFVSTQFRLTVPKHNSKGTLSAKMTMASSSPRFLLFFLLTTLCILSTKTMKAPNEIVSFHNRNRDFLMLVMEEEKEVEPMMMMMMTTTMQQPQLKEPRPPLHQDDLRTQNLRRRTKQQELQHDAPSTTYLKSNKNHSKNIEMNFLLQQRQLYGHDDDTSSYQSRKERQASVGHWILSMSPLICIFTCMVLACPCRQLTRYSNRIHGDHHITADYGTGDDILPSMAQNPTKRLQMIEDSLVTETYTQPSKHDGEEMNHVNVVILEKQQKEGKENQDSAGEVAKMGKEGLGNHDKQELSLSTTADLVLIDDTDSPSSQQTTVPIQQSDSDNEDYSTMNEKEECHDEYYSEECQICLESFQNNDKISWSTVSKCNHAFHHDCIIEWLKRHGTCPTCRGSFLYHKMPSPGHEEPEQQLDGGEHGETGAGSVIIVNNNITTHNHNTNSNNTNDDEDNDNQNSTTNNNV